MTESVVLVVSADALAGALLGAAVDLAGYSVGFPRPSESLRDSLRRVRPRIVFVDCDHDEGIAESFLGPAMMTGACIAIFGTPRSKRDFRRLANAYALQCFELPIEPEDLQKVLTACREQLEA